MTLTMQEFEALAPGSQVSLHGTRWTRNENGRWYCTTGRDTSTGVRTQTFAGAALGGHLTLLSQPDGNTFQVGGRISTAAERRAMPVGSIIVMFVEPEVRSMRASDRWTKTGPDAWTNDQGTTRASGASDGWLRDGHDRGYYISFVGDGEAFVVGQIITLNSERVALPIGSVIGAEANVGDAYDPHRRSHWIKTGDDQWTNAATGRTRGDDSRQFGWYSDRTAVEALAADSYYRLLRFGPDQATEETAEEAAEEVLAEEPAPEPTFSRADVDEAVSNAVADALRVRNEEVTRVIHQAWDGDSFTESEVDSFMATLGLPALPVPQEDVEVDVTVTITVEPDERTLAGLTGGSYHAADYEAEPIEIRVNFKAMREVDEDTCACDQVTSADVEAWLAGNNIVYTSITDIERDCEN